MKFGLGECRSSGLALQGRRMLGGDSSSSRPSGCRGTITRHPIVLFNTSAKGMKIGDSFQFLQTRGVHCQGSVPRDVGWREPWPSTIPASAFLWLLEKQEKNRMEERVRDPGSHRETRARGKTH